MLLVASWCLDCKCRVDQLTKVSYGYTIHTQAQPGSEDMRQATESLMRKASPADPVSPPKDEITTLLELARKKGWID